MQTTINYLLFLFFSLNLSAQSFSTLKDPSAFQQKLSAHAKKTQSLKSDFTQTKHLDILSEDIVSDGKLYFKANNKLRWEYIKPIQYLIILNNGNITVNDDGKVSTYDLSANKTFQKINEMVLSSIKGDLLIDETGYKYEFKESKSQYFVQMTPVEKQVQSYIKSIEIFFSKDDLSVSKVKMIENSGDFTTMKFKNQQINATISDKLFSAS